MNCTSTRLQYSDTGYFSKIITDYLKKSKDLAPFYKHATDLDGIKNAIEARKKFPHHRKVLVTELEKQYAVLQTTDAVKQNIRLLAGENTFTITTAHQPVIFTGTLFFIYKIFAIFIEKYRIS